MAEPIATCSPVEACASVMQHHIQQRWYASWPAAYVYDMHVPWQQCMCTMRADQHALTDVMPPMRVLAPDLEVKFGPASESFAAVVNVKRVRPHDHVAIACQVELCLAIFQAFQQFPGATSYDAPLHIHEYGSSEGMLGHAMLSTLLQVARYSLCKTDCPCRTRRRRGPGLRCEARPCLSKCGASSAAP